MKQWRYALGLCWFVNDKNDFFAELDNSFGILKKRVLYFCAIHKATAAYTAPF